MTNYNLAIMTQQRWATGLRVVLIAAVALVLLSAAATYLQDGSGLAAVLILGVLLFALYRLTGGLTDA